MPSTSSMFAVLQLRLRINLTKISATVWACEAREDFTVSLTLSLLRKIN